MGVYITVGAFILFDIITGFLKALYNGNVNSTYLRRGLYHKLSEVLAIAGSALLEHGVSYVNLGIDIPVVGVVAVYICTMELVSIFENLAEVNPTLEKLFKPFMEKLKEKDED